jgi:hypothetical protein
MPKEKWRDLANDNKKNNKQFTKYIQSKTNNKSGIGPLAGKDGKRTMDDKEMADILNQQFSSVFTREDTSNIPALLPETQEILEEIRITERDVRKQIRKLRADAAPGPDGISPRLLKDIENCVAAPLSLIFQKSLNEGKVPKEWKKATVVPIFKKGQKKDPSNYRPVSLTSVPCKMLESIIKEHMMNHLLMHSLLRDSQHGFLPGKSCASNLILTMDYLTKAVDEGLPVDLVYLDFSKAFDKVPHERLLVKVKAKGITGKVADWLEDWLKDRKQSVKVNGAESEESVVESGVPQGTILGPCLFNIHIDDIDVCAENLTEIKKFADDTKAYRTIRGMEDKEKLQRALTNMCEWAVKWGMEFNTAKCKVMHIGTNNAHYQYLMNDEQLGTTDSERDLGVIVEKSLKPSAQCKKAATKAKMVLNQITKNFHYRDRRHFLNLYKQYVRPHLEFASPAWSPWAHTDIQMLEKVQEQALKRTTGLIGRTYQERCAEVGLETLEERRRNQDMMHTFKILKGHVKIDSDHLFKRITNSSGTRSSSDPWNLQRGRSRKDTRLHSFGLRTIQHWNSLPSKMKEHENPESFKRDLKRVNRAS